MFKMYAFSVDKGRQMTPPLVDGVVHCVYEVADIAMALPGSLTSPARTLPDPTSLLWTTGNPRMTNIKTHKLITTSLIFINLFAQ